MARMSIDDMFLRDTRVLRLARAAGWSKYEARGRLLDVFAIVYDRVDAGTDDIVQAYDIDTAGEHEGLAALMLEHGLAEKVRGGVRVRGAKDRTNYLATRHESGRLGGLKSAETRRAKAKQQSKVTFDNSEGRTNPSPSASPSASPSVLPSADPDPTSLRESAPQAALAIDEFKAKVDASANPLKPPKPRKRILEPSAAERDVCVRVLSKLGARNGVRYSGTPAHFDLITFHLRNGITELDLRGIIAYCADEKRWLNDPKYHEYLRPETLFGRETLSKYLDPARAYVAKHRLSIEPEEAS